MGGGSLIVSLLPTVFHSLLGIDAIYVYKAVFPIVIAFIPVVTYAICVRYLTPLFAFLSACFVMAQIPFMYLLTGQMRVGVSLLFMTLAIMALFDSSIGARHRSALLIVFGVSAMVAYYVTPILLAVLMATLWLASKLPRSPLRSRGIVRASSVLLLIMFVSLWWGVAVQTQPPGESLDALGRTAGPIETPAPGETPDSDKKTTPATGGYVDFLRDVLADISPSEFSDPELRGPEVQLLLGLPDISISRQVTVIVNYAAFVAIGIGVMALWLVRRNRKIVDPGYTLLMFTALVLAALPIILPRLSSSYAGDRLYLQLVFILAPAFVIGCQAIARYVPPRRELLVLGPMLVGLFLCNSYLLHQFSGSPRGDILDTEAPNRARSYVYDSEVQAADWLGYHNGNSTPVYIGSMTQPQPSGGIFEFTSHAVDRSFRVRSFEKDALASDTDSWVFLRRINVVDKLGYNYDEHDRSELFSMAEYASLLNGRNKVYTTGDTEIYR
jgi:uncharacterized membrane protein